MVVIVNLLEVYSSGAWGLGRVGYYNQRLEEHDLSDLDLAIDAIDYYLVSFEAITFGVAE